MLTPDSRLADFPSLHGRTYLNTAAESLPPPDAVRLDASLALDQLEVEATAAVLRRLRLA